MIKFVTITNRTTNQVEHLNVQHILKFGPVKDGVGTWIDFTVGPRVIYKEDCMTVINRLIMEVVMPDATEKSG